LLPGSHKQEITKMLTGMLSIVDFPDYQFVIAVHKWNSPFMQPIHKNENTLSRIKPMIY
jgi:lipid-A-disaccharide synthase